MIIDIPNQSEIICNYGVENQLAIHMEELAELTQAVSKGRRWLKDNFIGNMPYSIKSNVCEEVADVLICMEQMKTIFGIQDSEIELIVKKKYERQRQRMIDEWAAKETEWEDEE